MLHATREPSGATSLSPEAASAEPEYISIAARRSGYALDGVNFLVAAMQAGFGIFVTVYLVKKGWGAQAIGFALTLSTMTALISQMPAGALIDELRDKRRAVQTGVVGVGAAALLLALT